MKRGEYLEPDQVKGKHEVAEAGHLNALVLVKGGNLGDLQLGAEEAEHGVDFVGITCTHVDEQSDGVGISTRNTLCTRRESSL